MNKLSLCMHQVSLIIEVKWDGMQNLYGLDRKTRLIPIFPIINTWQEDTIRLIVYRQRLLLYI